MVKDLSSRPRSACRRIKIRDRRRPATVAIPTLRRDWRARIDGAFLTPDTCKMASLLGRSRPPRRGFQDRACLSRSAAKRQGLRTLWRTNDPPDGGRREITLILSVMTSDEIPSSCTISRRGIHSRRYCRQPGTRHRELWLKSATSSSNIILPSISPVAAQDCHLVPAGGCCRPRRHDGEQHEQGRSRQSPP